MVKNQEIFDLFATSAKGLEELLAEELRQVGAESVKVVRAGVSFRGPLAVAYRACLESRVASRVLLPLKKFPAPTPEKLYGGTKSIRWSDHLGARQTLAVDFTSVRSDLTHTHFGALKVKDAIVDQLRSVHGERPSIDVMDPDVRVHVHLQDNVAEVSIDLSGQSLHKRGYRDQTVPAPLKENLAAALLLLAKWPERAAQKTPFLDPMCGSGTILIEAALIATRTAPGLFRRRFGFEGWKKHDPGLWHRVKAEAQAKIIRDPKALPRMTGTDQDVRAVRASLVHIEQAGLHGLVHVERREFSESAPFKDELPEGQSPKGIMVFNPPYGERLGEIEELKPLYASVGNVLKQRFTGWESYLLTSAPDLAKAVRLEPSRKFVVFNGAIECRLLRYDVFSGSGRRPKPEPVPSTEG